MDLSHAVFRGANLTGAKLDRANLTDLDAASVVLDGSSLIDANLDRAWLRNGSFLDANFSGGHLHDASFTSARLLNATFVGASLCRADFGAADLRGADLSETNLIGSRFKWSRLEGAKLFRAKMGSTTLEGLDLSTAEGLATVEHWRKSDVGIQCLLRTGAKSEESRVFFRNAGTPQVVLDYVPSLVGALSPLDFYSVFISYSSEDTAFAHRIYADLQNEGIQCWLDEKQVLPGDNIAIAIDEGIRVWDYLLLCCSETALGSWWVDFELRKTFSKERRLSKDGRFVSCLIPLTIDDHVFDVWEHELRDRVLDLKVADFRGWETEKEKYDEQLTLLVRKLRADASAREDKPAPKLGVDSRE